METFLRAQCRFVSPNHMTSRMTLIVLNYSISRSIYSRSLKQSSYPRHVKSQSRSDRREDLFRQRDVPPSDRAFIRLPFQRLRLYFFGRLGISTFKMIFRDTQLLFQPAWYCYLRLENWIFHVTQRICALHFILREMTFGDGERFPRIIEYRTLYDINTQSKYCLQITFRNNSNDNVPHLRKIERIIHFHIHSRSKIKIKFSR